MINKKLLYDLANKFNIILSEDELNKFDIYAKELVSWNEKINLTAITQPDDICVKHFFDSLLLLDAIDVKENAKMIDVGTGAGFPSIPCKIYRNDIELILLDSLNKRINFLNEISNNIGINTSCIHSRAEDAGKKDEYREKFDIATARAVAHLRELSEYCLPFVKVGGYFVSLKGYEIEEEIEESKKAIKLLGGKIIDVKKYDEDNKRSIIIIKKISQTPTKYPRISAKIKKQPIK